MDGPVLSKILYVDDDSDIRTIVELSLATVGGYRTCICSSGQEALEKISDFDPDMILLDVMMPDMDGPATLQRISAIPDKKQIPVIFMTAKVQQQEIQSYKELGAIDVITKPFDPMTLHKQLLAIWERYQRNRKRL